MEYNKICQICGNEYKTRKEKSKFCSQKCHYQSRSIKWSSKYDKCKQCGKTESRHEGFGLCQKCYQKYNKETVNSRSRKYRLKKRKKVLEHYGGKCECCGETTYEFLSLDHINGGGNKHRKEIGSHMDYWIIKNNYPPIFRVLCHNCNLAIGFYKVCPHKQIKKDNIS